MYSISVSSSEPQISFLFLKTKSIILVVSITNDSFVLGGEYEVTAKTTDGTNCTRSLKITINESKIATVLRKDIVVNCTRIC